MEQSTAQSSHETRGLVLAITSVICFSATSLALSYTSAKHGVDCWVAASYRGIFGLLVILVLQGRTGKLQLHHIVTNRLLFVRGLIGETAIPVYYLCIIELGPGRASVIGGSYHSLRSRLCDGLDKGGTQSQLLRLHWFGDFRPCCDLR